MDTENNFTHTHSYWVDGLYVTNQVQPCKPVGYVEETFIPPTPNLHDDD